MRDKTESLLRQNIDRPKLCSATLTESKRSMSMLQYRTENSPLGNLIDAYRERSSSISHGRPNLLNKRESDLEQIEEEFKSHGRPKNISSRHAMTEEKKKETEDNKINESSEEETESSDTGSDTDEEDKQDQEEIKVSAEPKSSEAPKAAEAKAASPEKRKDPASLSKTVPPRVAYGAQTEESK